MPKDVDDILSIDEASSVKSRDSSFDNHNNFVKTQKNLILELDPLRCKPWRFHDRDEAWLHSEANDQLIHSIQASGQLEPGLVRKLNGDPHFDYEIIYGVRRWHACKQLKKFSFRAQITESDDKTCMIMMYAENVNSKNITEFEKACAFSRQIKSGVFKSQTEMAQALGLTQGYISKLFKAADIYNYEFIRQLFPNKLDISVKDAYVLSVELKDPYKIERIALEAQKIQEEIEKTNIYPKARTILKKLLNTDHHKAKQTHHLILNPEHKAIVRCTKDGHGNFSLFLLKEAKDYNPEYVKEVCLKALSEFFYNNYSPGNRD